MAQLTGNQISQTFQKLIQIDSSVPVTGNYTFDMDTAISTEYCTLLNGVGNKHVGIVIDQSSENDGGVFIKNANLYGFQNRGNELRFVKNNNEQLAFLRNTGTFHIGDQSVSDISGYNLYVDRGIFIKDPGKFNVSDGSTTTNNARLNVSATNHYITSQIPDKYNDYFNNVQGQGKNVDIFKSGRHSDNGIDILWQRSGSVVTCNGFIDHENNSPDFLLPTYTSDSGGVVQFETDDYLGLIGHGTNTFFGEIIVESQSNDRFAIFRFNQNLNANVPVYNGVSYFSFSYRFVG